MLNLPYADNHFDTVLLISILEHLKVRKSNTSFHEVSRVLKPGGQVVYGVPVERPLMSFLFWFMGYSIHDHHFSTEEEIHTTANQVLKKVRLVGMRSDIPACWGHISYWSFFKSSGCLGYFSTPGFIRPSLTH